MCRIELLKRANKVVQDSKIDEEKLILVAPNNEDNNESLLSYSNISHFERLEAAY